MPQLMQMSNKQYLLTIPQEIVRLLQAKKGDQMEFKAFLKRGTVELTRVEEIDSVDPVVGSKRKGVRSNENTPNQNHTRH